MGSNRKFQKLKTTRKAILVALSLFAVVSLLTAGGITQHQADTPVNVEEVRVERPYIPQHIYSQPASGEVLAQQVTFQLGWPVEKGRGKITQCVSETHNGMDIADEWYPDVVAAHRGKVTFAGCQPGNCPEDGEEVGGRGLARSVVIEHESGVTTVYGHLNQVYVKAGSYVETGTAIGQMGRSGETNGGVHLHFMLTERGMKTVYDPAKFMDSIACPETD